MQLSKKSPKKKSLETALIAVILCVMTAAAPVHARHNTQVKNTWGGEGPAIQGYDPVAYFTMEKAVKGSEEFAHEWLGAKWHFINAEHRDLFAADPTQFAPQHGGYCAVGADGGGTYSANPEAWRIADGKLYLFYSDDTASSFDPTSASTTQADASWQNELLDLLKH